MLGPNAQISESIQDLTTLNGKLQRLANQLGTRQDTKQLQQSLDQETKAGMALCQQIVGLLQKSSQENPSVPNKRMVAKLSQQFETQMNRFREVERLIVQKRTAAAEASRQAAAEASRDLERGGPGQHQQQDYQQIDIRFLEYDLEEVERRHQGIQQIEQSIHEIGEMFRDLHALVHEQGESLSVIESNLVGTKEQTAEAHEQLLKAEVYQKKARKKKCCLIFIGVAVLAAVILIATQS